MALVEERPAEYVVWFSSVHGGIHFEHVSAWDEADAIERGYFRVVDLFEAFFGLKFDRRELAVWKVEER